ncbi:hypothetical protein AO265_39615 [Pseudomonas sp. ABAC61]|nr:hypothetical protein AO265_39615 [Pseudomonas sp. ABAC61]
MLPLAAAADASPLHKDEGTLLFIATTCAVGMMGRLGDRWKALRALSQPRRLGSGYRSMFMG